MTSLMTRHVRILLPLAFCLILAGCWDRQEVDTLAFITATAVDARPGETKDGSDDSYFELSMHIIDPATESAGGIMEKDSSAGNVAGVVVSAKGLTPLDAHYNFQAQLPRVAFFAHNRVIIIAEELARSDVLSRIVDFFDRGRQSRRSAFVAIAQDIAAREVLAAGFPLEPSSGEGLAQVIRINHQTVAAPAVTLNDFLVDVSLEGIDPIAGRIRPVRKADASPSRQGSDVLEGARYSGVALFRGDRLVGWLDEPETRGLLWATGRANAAYVNITCPDSPTNLLTLEIVRASGKIDVQTTPELRGRIRLIAEGHLADVECPGGFRRSSEGVSETNDRLAAVMENNIKGALEKTKSLGTDPFGFGAAIMRADPALWQQVRERWYDSIWPELPVDIEITATVRRPGLISSPYEVRR